VRKFGSTIPGKYEKSKQLSAINLSLVPFLVSSVSSPCHFQLKMRTGQMLPELSANRVKEIFIYNLGAGRMVKIYFK
jgi:hypothetical protein